MKAYTDIEQSKKLSEILPIDSADMWYSYYGTSTYNPVIVYNGEQWFLCQIKNHLYDIPCWSLAALLEVLQKYIYNRDIENFTKQEINFTNIICHCCYDYKRFIKSTLYCLTKQDKIDIHPATKEQRNLLFQKMKQAGYEWNENIKQLIKL